MNTHMANRFRSIEFWAFHTLQIEHAMSYVYSSVVNMYNALGKAEEPQSFIITRQSTHHYRPLWKMIQKTTN